MTRGLPGRPGAAAAAEGGEAARPWLDPTAAAARAGLPIMAACRPPIRAGPVALSHARLARLPPGCRVRHRPAAGVADLGRHPPGAGLAAFAGHLLEGGQPAVDHGAAAHRQPSVGVPAGVGGAPAEKIEPEEEEAIAALDAGDYAKAEAAYKKLLARKPNDNFAILGLAQTQLMARTDAVDGAKVMQDASAHPDDIAIQLQCADIEIVSGYLEPAFARLLRLIPLFDGAEKKLVKDRLIELFALVDPADPRVIKARAALANALF